MPEFKYLAIKNWPKYQPKNSQNYPWIRDYKERDLDDDYSRLTCMQRYMLDACCRLRGRYDRNIANDPLWICRATAVLPRERHNATTAIRQLIDSGFLVLTDQQIDPLVEDSKGKERVVKDSIPSDIAPPIPEDSDFTISAIANAHPRNTKPGPAERAICVQLERLTQVKGMIPQVALAYLMERTVLFSNAVKKWPKEELKFIPESHNWFSQSCFEADESLWIYQPKGNSHGNDRESEQRAIVKSGVAKAVEQIFGGKNGVGAQHVPQSKTDGIDRAKLLGGMGEASPGGRKGFV